MFDWHYDPAKIQKENEAVFLKKTAVVFEWFLLSEIISREDFSKFLISIEDIYSTDPALKMSLEKRSLNKMLSDINYRWCTFLPLIGKKRFSWVMGMDLPKSIKFIKIKIDKICADFVTLQILVLLDNEVDVDFNKIMMSYHYPELIEHYNIPWTWSSYSIIDCQRRKRQDVKKFIDNLKRESLIYIESVLWLWEFFKMKNDDWFNSFPVLNIFSFLWDKEELTSNRDYLNVIGFSYNRVDTYKHEDEYLLSIWDLFFRDSWETFFTLLIDWGKFKNYKIDFSPYGALDDFNFYIISIYQWLKSIQRDIDQITNSITSSSGNFEFILSRKIELIKLFIIFDRLKSVMMKFKLRSWIFERIEKIGTTESGFENLYLESIKGFIETQNPVIQHTQDNINSLFDLKNTQLNIKSQTIMWWLTVAMLILAVVQVLLLEYDQNKHVYSWLWKSIWSLFSAIF